MDMGYAVACAPLYAVSLYLGMVISYNYAQHLQIESNICKHSYVYYPIVRSTAMSVILLLAKAASPKQRKSVFEGES